MWVFGFRWPFDIIPGFILVTILNFLWWKFWRKQWGYKPNPPENLHATKITKQSITIAWDKSEDAEFYTISRDKTRLSAAYRKHVKKDGGLHPGVQYEYQVSAVNDFGESEPAIITEATKEEEIKEEVKEEEPKKVRRFFTSYSLDDEQRDAVQYDYDRPLMVRSGPGSGKTRVVKERIKDIVLEQGIDPNKILCLSFSKAAQQTMLDRFKDDVDLKGKLEEIIKKREENGLEALSEERIGDMRSISIGEDSVRTIHSLGLQISPSKKISNYEFKQFQNEINADDFKKISDKYPINKKGNPNFKEKLKDGVSAWKREALSLDDLENYIKNITRKWEAGDYRGRKDEWETQSKIEKYKELSKYFKKYQEFLGEKGKIDYDDMIMNSVEKLKNYEKILEDWQGRYDHVIVDEFQDNNYLQTEIARLLSPKGHVTVVGDEDQCIYVFQGAHVENFEHFEDHFKHFNVEKKTLRTNYRSTEEIVDKSSKLMDNVKDRVTKDLIAHRNEKGNPVVMIECEKQEDEFDYICKKIMELQESISPPLSLKDFAVFFRKNRDVYNFINFLKNNPSPDIRNLQDANIKNIHKSKGEEYRVVFVAHVENDNIPTSFQEKDFEVPVALQKFKQDLDDSIAHEREERRVLYVAMTRAKDHLFLTYHTTAFKKHKEITTEARITSKMRKDGWYWDDESKNVMIDVNISRSEFLNNINIKHEKYENSENEEQGQ
jgi:DNA helicase-2/ATP-dependent DNA helicase PcrA